MKLKYAYVQLLLLAIFLTVALVFHIRVIVMFGFSALRVVLVAVTLVCMAATAAMYGYFRKRDKSISKRQ